MSLNPEPAPLLTLRLVGEPSIAGPGQAPRPLERRDAALLAMLALDGPQPRARLARWLWPAVEDAAALRNLRQRFFRLARATGGAAAVQGQGAVRLHAQVAHDLDAARAISRREEGGTLLGVFDYADCEPLAERVDALRARWRRMCIEALDAALTAAERDQRLDEALALADRAVGLQPDGDRAWERLLRLHLVRGEPTQGLAAYERFAQVQRRWGSEPGPTLLQLARQLRQAEQLPVKPALTLAQPPRLVGREADWALLRDAWQAARPVVLRGAPGIGKSRLAWAFARSAGPVLALKAVEDQQHEVYGLLARLWAAASPRLPAAADWASSLLSSLGTTATHGTAVPEHRIHAAVRTALQAWPASGLGSLLLDDLQWADAASLNAILDWLQDPPACPPVLLVLRSGEPPAALGHWLDRAAPGKILDHTLGPLDDAAVHAFVQSLELPGVAAGETREVARRLQHAVGGHPFLLLEMLRAESSELSPRGRDAASTPMLLHALGQRIGRLPAGPLRLLRLAALAAGEFSVPLAAEVLGVHAVDLVDDWTTLTAAGFMQEDGTVFDLVVTATRQSLPPPIARELHRQLAQCGSRLGARPACLAEHWRGAGCWADAAAGFEAAAAAAASLSRLPDALALWDRAAECHERAGNATARWHARLQAADAASGAEGGAEWVRRTRELAQDAAPSPIDHVDALLQYGRALVNIEADPSEGVAVLEQALDAARAHADQARGVMVAGVLILGLASQGQHDRVRALIDGLDDIVDHLPPSQATLMYHGPKGVALYYAGEYETSLRATRMAVEHAQAIGNLAAELNERANLGVAYRAVGRTDAAAEEYELALVLWDRLHRPRSSYSMPLLLHAAALDVERGRFDRALSMATQARDYFAATGSSDWQVVAEARLFTAYFRLGQFARARQALSPLPAETNVNRRIGRLMQLCRLGHVAGKPVLETLRRAVADDGPQLFRRNQLTLRAQLAEALPAQESLPVAEGVLADAQAWNDVSMLAAACALVADALRGLGRCDEAARMAQRAWEHATRQAANWMSHVELCWLVHQAAQAGGRHELAALALDSGAVWIDRALPHVPPTYVESFMHRHPVNQALLTRSALQRRGSAPS